jgi:hypothetical protein
MRCAICLLKQVLKHDVPYSQSAMERPVASDVDSKSRKHTSVKIPAVRSFSHVPESLQYINHYSAESL